MADSCSWHDAACSSTIRDRGAHHMLCSAHRKVETDIFTALVLQSNTISMILGALAVCCMCTVALEMPNCSTASVVARVSLCM